MIIRFSRHEISPDLLANHKRDSKIQFLEHHLGKKYWELPLYFLIETLDQMKVHFKIVNEGKKT